MKSELAKRIITSIFLICLLLLAFKYNYILIISLIIITLISWIEFNALFSKIFNKKKFFNFLLKATSLLYLFFFSFFIFSAMIDPILKNFTIYIFCICIFSDIGGLIFGKFFGGKKLTKISPKKTISGSLGSFIFSLALVPLFINLYNNQTDFFLLSILTITISFICQLGDLIISYLKRKAKVKDTGDILPGHGGILDRIDGILLAVPIGLVLFNYL
tara:strand:+ start:76 stop:726 length:651 start_codon:yes stop_codon:yes gene_type:complete